MLVYLVTIDIDNCIVLGGNIDYTLNADDIYNFSNINAKFRWLDVC